MPGHSGIDASRVINVVSLSGKMYLHTCTVVTFFQTFLGSLMLCFPPKFNIKQGTDVRYEDVSVKKYSLIIPTRKATSFGNCDRICRLSDFFV